MPRYHQRSKIPFPQKRKPIRKVGKVKHLCLKVNEIFKSIVDYIKIYFKSSCLHGLKYLAKKDVSWTQKAVWLLVLIICNVSCFLIGFQSFDRFRNKSTVVGVERDYHYWNTSIPSLTVCSFDRLNREKFQSYCDKQNITDQLERDEFFQFLESLANSTYFNFQNIRGSFRVDEILKRLNIFPQNYMELIYNLTKNYILLPELDAIQSTDWRVDVYTRQILTEYGICYMTNSVLGLEYSSEYALFRRYPQKRSSQRTTISVLKGTYFDADITIDFLGFPKLGFDSFLHSINEVSRIDNNIGYLTETVQYTTFTQEIIVDDDFEKAVSINQRKCRFHYESNLTHFPLYTNNLCLQECRLNMAMEFCKCIPHFYPNRIDNPKPVCHYKTLQKCFPELESNFLELYRTVNGKKVPINCFCLPNCEDAIVTLKRVHVLNLDILKATKSLFTEGLGVRMTVEDWPTQRLKRQVVFSLVDLMVSLGSTAGLFLGFSVLSGVELVYFFTIRLFFHMRGIKI